MKKLGNLRRNESQPSNRYKFCCLNQRQREDSRDRAEKIERTCGSHRTQKIEMEDEKEEAKESA